MCSSIQSNLYGLTPIDIFCCGLILYCPVLDRGTGPLQRTVIEIKVGVVNVAKYQIQSTSTKFHSFFWYF